MDVRSATAIVPLGLIGNEQGSPINIADFALAPVPPPVVHPRTVAVIGTSMNSGKTTTIHYLVHGFSRAGLRPGATKVTGTGSGGDYWVMIDAGAHRMLDFTDAGLASTYRQPMEVIERTFRGLVDQLTHSGTGINLVEVADGIYQRETAQLIASDTFAETVDAVIFAAADAMGAAAGVAHLRGLGLDVVAVSGRLTRSPLATREAAAATGLPVLTIAELSDAGRMADLLGLDAPLLGATATDSSLAAVDALHPPSDVTIVLDNESGASDVGASAEGALAGDRASLVGELRTAR
jgi:molybdopterin-guanine dinucleotide biosynthesis protein